MAEDIKVSDSLNGLVRCMVTEDIKVSDSLTGLGRCVYS